MLLEDKTTDLTYNICSMRLTGAIDGARVELVAFSGGRAGSKTKGAVNPVLANNPFHTGHKLDPKKKDDIGGAIPQGYYTLHAHETKPNWIRLVPASKNYMQGRDGFAIHGRGVRGSDGCLVPPDFKDVMMIYNAVKKRREEKKAAITLKVIAVGDLDFYLRFNRMG